MLWHVLAVKPPFGSGLLIRHAVVGWKFLPAILLLQRVLSRWMLLVVALAAAEMAVSLRQLFSADVEATQEDGLARTAGDLQMLYGLPSGGSGPLRSFVIALCAQVSPYLFAVAGHLVWAGVLLARSLWVCFVIWRLYQPLQRPARQEERRATGRRTLSVAASLPLAIFITVLALVPWMVRPLRMGATTREVLLRQPMVHMPEFRRPDSSYVSVVLWPPKPPKKIVAPVPRGLLGICEGGDDKASVDSVRRTLLVFRSAVQRAWTAGTRCAGTADGCWHQHALYRWGGAVHGSAPASRQGDRTEML